MLYLVGLNPNIKERPMYIGELLKIVGVGMMMKGIKWSFERNIFHAVVIVMVQYNRTRPTFILMDRFFD